jgi:hypothetical protein
MSPCTSATDPLAVWRALAAAAFVALAAGPTAAQPAASVCQSSDLGLAPSLAAWTAKIDVVSATGPAGLGPAELRVGQAARVTLHGTREVSYSAQPAKPGGSVAHGGLLGLSVDRAGTYRVVLSSAAWVDVVRDGQAVASIAHGHGPDCSTIRKMVDYPLQPGVYVLQISANADPQAAVMVTGAP